MELFVLKLHIILFISSSQGDIIVLVVVLNIMITLKYSQRIFSHKSCPELNLDLSALNFIRYLWN